MELLMTFMVDFPAYVRLSVGPAGSNGAMEMCWSLLSANMFFQCLKKILLVLPQTICREIVELLDHPPVCQDL